MEEETPELADEGMEVTNDQEPYASAQQTKIFEELLTCSWRQVAFQNGITSMAVLEHAIMRTALGYYWTPDMDNLVLSPI